MRNQNRGGGLDTFLISFDEGPVDVRDGRGRWPDPTGRRRRKRPRGLSENMISDTDASGSQDGDWMCRTAAL
jgi:hypothetical protein